MLFLKIYSFVLLLLITMALTFDAITDKDVSKVISVLMIIPILVFILVK